jgi:hypothetical protein
MFQKVGIHSLSYHYNQSSNQGLDQVRRWTRCEKFIPYPPCDFLTFDFSVRLCHFPLIGDRRRLQAPLRCATRSVMMCALFLFILSGCYYFTYRSRTIGNTIQGSPLFTRFLNASYSYSYSFFSFVV